MMPDDNKPLTPKQAREKLQRGLVDYLAGNDPGPIVFRLKRTKKASETYPLKLTEKQREVLLRCTNLSRTLKKKIEQAGAGTQIVPVTWNELHRLSDETGESAVYALTVDKNRLMAVQGRVVKFFEEEHAEVFDDVTPKPRKTRSTKSDLLYQFKITLSRSTPPIWRRIQVRDCTLDKLHEHVQTAMGWTNSHLHHFRVGKQLYGDPWLMAENMNEFGYRASTRTKISQVVPKSGERFQFLYEYDFGDGWDHEILFEGCPKKESGKKYPACLEGERACPPEDVGGIGGFYEFVKILANPKHEQHDDMKGWVGEFEAKEFDAGKATKAMKKGLPNWRE